ncbi:hypothetical protein RchiOBHm_Chr2g0116531 [Rosa chinensis]|uniref:Uncharacterized protein n=1 Tax=Rosa chinensis TaxID=74649 RepID=A0A2P6RR91_ROSCH|nr:hypothetical protein RchiOBHm_Chr2g0116531 [Rosa chinensis]
MGLRSSVLSNTNCEYKMKMNFPSFTFMNFYIYPFIICNRW